MTRPAMIKRLKAGLREDETGNKANSLIFLHKYGFNIPLTYLVTTCAHELYLRKDAGILEELSREVMDLPDITYAIRSSTTAEDSKEFSYAGQFQTITNVRGAENIIKAIQKVWESTSLLNDNEYLTRTGLSSIKCAVIIQEMIPSKLAGVCFSRNPVTNQNEIILEAVEGYGEELVQKGVSPLRWRIHKGRIIEGNSQYPDISVIKQVAKDTVRLKRYYGQNIDIEWVYDGRKLYYLQLRQITGRKDINIYSNKMAKEMLPGQIKPLVWSVNIPLVNGTWVKLLSEITGPLKIQPEDLAKPFYYQTYFNIVVLGKIFNEFGMSTDSLEYLMLRSEDSKPAFKPGFKTIRHTFRIIRFLNNKLNFEKIYIREYNALRIKYSKIDELLKKEVSPITYPDLYSMLFEEGKNLAYLNIVTPMLMSLYHRRLKKQLLKAKLDYDKLDFRRDFPELNLYDPLIFFRKIKILIDGLPEAIKEQCVSLEKLRTFKEAENIVSAFDNFIKEFGHFSESGNDFSFTKWEEDPEMVFNMILTSSPIETSNMYSLNDIKQSGQRISPGLLKNYNKAGRFKVYREQISSLYIYGYGLFRKLFLHLGQLLREKGIVESEHDIFYLRKEEIDTVVDNIESTQTNHYQELIQRRRDEMEETKDIVLPMVIYGEEAPILASGKVKNLSGTGTSSGSYSGKTRVVKKIEDFGSVSKGDVLLIPFSDVSWTPVLTRAGAIVSETGGLLSHCSIIARELGIPALVSVENACLLGNGLNVTVDGSNGILTIHDYE